MKKIFQFIMLCVMGITLASCGESIDPAEECEKAIAEGDFAKAHEMFNKCSRDFINNITKGRAGDNYVSPVVLEYKLYNAEVNYIVSEAGDTDIDKKILLLMNEVMWARPEIYQSVAKTLEQFGHSSLAQQVRNLPTDIE